MSQQNQSDSNEFPKILELDFSIGGWTSKKRLTLEGNEVNVFPPARFGWPEAVITHSPSEEEWLEFSKSLKRLDVANWKRSYMDPHILDGTQWRLMVITEASEIETGGSNAYPEYFNGLILDSTPFSWQKEMIFSVGIFPIRLSEAIGQPPKP